MQSVEPSQPCRALQNLAEPWETGWQVAVSPHSFHVFTHYKRRKRPHQQQKGKQSTVAQAQIRITVQLQWTWTWNGWKYLLVYFHFSFERFPLFQSNWVVPSTQWSSCSSSFIIYCISKDPANSLIMWCSALYMLYHCDRTKSCVYLCCSWGMPLV